MTSQQGRLYKSYFQLKKRIYIQILMDSNINHDSQLLNINGQAVRLGDFTGR